MKGKQKQTILTVLFSIIDVIWFLIWFGVGVSIGNTGPYIGHMLLASVFPIAHVIVTYVLLLKKGSKPLKKQTALTIILLIIDVAWLSFFASISGGNDAKILLAFAFPLAHAIFALVLFFRKRAKNGKKNSTILTVLFSIIDVIWFFSWFAVGVSNGNMGAYIGHMLLASAFPIAHVIVTYVLLLKKGSKPLKKLTALTIILLIIDVAWFFIFVSLPGGNDANALLAFAFPLAHAIFALVLLFRKRAKNGKKNSTILTILFSIIDVIWFFSWFAVGVSNGNTGAYIGHMLLASAFPIAHVIVTYVLLLKKGSKPLKKLTALTIILFIVDVAWFFIFTGLLGIDPGNETTLILLAFAFPLAHAIFALVLSFRKGTMRGLRVLSIVDLVFIVLGFGITSLMVSLDLNFSEALLSGAVCAAVFPIIYGIIVFILSLKEHNKTLRIMAIPVLVFTACIAAFIGVVYFASKNEGNNEFAKIINAILNFNPNKNDWNNEIGKIINFYKNFDLNKIEWNSEFTKIIDKNVNLNFVGLEGREYLGMILYYIFHSIPGIVTGIFILFDAYAVFLAVYIIVISVTAAKKPALEQNNKPAEEGLLATEGN